MSSPFCLAQSTSWFLLLRDLSLNLIHSKIISGATYRIIGLTKIRISSARFDLPFYSNNDGMLIIKSNNASSTSWFLLLRDLSLNWIHSKIISGATYRIIGLTKIRISSARFDLPFYSNNDGVRGVNDSPA